MYCVNCGVKLADTEQKCPLCGVEVYHPVIKPQPGAPLYPAEQYPAPVSSFSLMVVLTTAFLLSMLIAFLCDMHMGPQITWSGYVIGGLLTAYYLQATVGTYAFLCLAVLLWRHCCFCIST